MPLVLPEPADARDSFRLWIPGVRGSRKVINVLAFEIGIFACNNLRHASGRGGRGRELKERESE